MHAYTFNMNKKKSEIRSERLTDGHIINRELKFQISDPNWFSGVDWKTVLFFFPSQFSKLIKSNKPGPILVPIRKKDNGKDAVWAI